MENEATYVRRNERTRRWEVLKKGGWQPTGWVDDADFRSVKVTLNDRGMFNVVWLRNLESTST